MKPLLALLLVAAGCSGATLPGDFDLAQTRERARDDEGALALYRLAADNCLKPGAVARPHDDCALARFRQAQLEEKLRRYPDAYRSYLAAADVSRDPRRGARALVRAALLAADELRDEPAAERLAWRAVESFPDEVPADDALALAVRLGKRRDAAALALRLQALYPRVAQLDLGDNVLYELGELHRAAGDGPGAVAIYDQLAATYKRSGLRDDSIWHAAELLRAAGDARGALRHLQIILDSRRDALITGSYNSIYLDDAQLLVGKIWLDDLHQAEPAISAFRALADDYKESILRDDALVELARAYLQRHTPPSENDHRDACKSLARLFRQYPNSNCLRAGHALAEELSCNP